MNSALPTLVSVVTFALTGLAALLAFLASQRSKLSLKEPIEALRGQLEQVIRAETDRLRNDHQSEARALRQEITESIRGFQGSVFEAFRSLSEPLQGDMRTFSQTVGAGLRASEERSAAIATRVEQELLRLAKSAFESQETLRATIELRLENYGDKSRTAARELREELGASSQRVLDTISTGLRTSEERTALIADKVEQEFLRLSRTASQAQEELRSRVETRLEQFGDKSTTASRELREELSNSTKTLQQLLLQTLDTRLAELTQNTAGQSQALRAELAGASQAMSATLTETLQRMSEQQLERLNTLVSRLESLTEQHGKAHEALRQSVEGRLDVLRNENVAKLEEMRRTVDEKLQSTLEARLSESFRLVSQQLESVHRGLGEMQTLAAGVGDLKKVLANVKVRGTWGEVQLGNLLEQFLSPDQYIHNAQIRLDSQERVEYAIRMPGQGEEKDCLMPIDAKFPQEDYSRLIAAADRGDGVAVEEASSALEARIKGFARSIREKYIDTPRTTPFAILFLPTESLYAELLRRPGLFESLYRDFYVTLAGPTTLAAMLNAYQMGFRSMAIQKRSTEVWQVLGAVRTEFNKHGKVVETLHKQLNTAVHTIEQLGRRTRVMNRTLRDVETVPETQAAGLLALDVAQSALEEAAGDIKAAKVDEAGAA